MAIRKQSPSKQAKRTSRYAGISSISTGAPVLGPGEYIVRVRKCEVTFNPASRHETFKGHIDVVESDNSDHPKGSEAIMLSVINGTGTQGLARVKAFVMAAAGYADDESFDAFDPDCEFIECCTGDSDAFQGEPMQNIDGRLVRCVVSRGNKMKDKDDYYNNYAWFPIDDDDED